MLSRDVDQASTGVSACGLGQFECAVNTAFRFELTFDLNPISGRKEKIGENLEALCGEIHEGALTGGSIAAQEDPPVDGDAKVMAWIGLACLSSSNNGLDRNAVR